MQAGTTERIRANDPKHWRDLAEESRTVADMFSNDEARRHMIVCAEAYEHLAMLAEQGPLYRTRPADKEPVR